MINDTAISNFRGELTEIDISSLLNANLATDPNTDYEKFEKIITKTYDKPFPEKRVKFNRYKHKRSNWITSGILKSGVQSSETNYINVLKSVLQMMVNTIY